MSTEKIDWKAIREHLERVGEGIEKGDSPARLDREAVLRARAERLAREPEETKVEDCIEVVEFLLGGEQYGIETSYVREVYPIRDYTPVPCTPPLLSWAS